MFPPVRSPMVTEKSWGAPTPLSMMSSVMSPVLGQIREVGEVGVGGGGFLRGRPGRRSDVALAGGVTGAVLVALDGGDPEHEDPPPPSAGGVDGGSRSLRGRPGPRLSDVPGSRAGGVEAPSLRGRPTRRRTTSPAAAAVWRAAALPPGDRPGGRPTGRGEGVVEGAAEGGEEGVPGAWTESSSGRRRRGRVSCPFVVTAKAKKTTRQGREQKADVKFRWHGRQIRTHGAKSVCRQSNNDARLWLR